MNILGISALFHDAAACLLQDGVLVAAAQEERFSRNKHDPSMPKRAVRYCLEHAGLSMRDIDSIAYYESPQKKLERQIWSALPELTREKCMKLWQRATQPISEIREILGYDGPVEVVEHHASHAASAFYFSGYDEAAILTVDGVGEWTTTSYGKANGRGVEMLEEVEYPHSIGLCYSALTSYLGFSVNDGEYKVMGLAPYGQPTFVPEIQKLLLVEDRGQFRLNGRYFEFNSEKRMYSDELVKLLGQPPRQRGSEILQFHRDVARSLQYVLEEVLLAKARHLYEMTTCPNLCMAGGVALNCVANARILTDGPFERMFVQPGAGDAGACLGAAAVVHKRRSEGWFPQQAMVSACLGSSFSADEIFKVLSSTSIRFVDYRGQEPALLQAVAKMLMAGKIIGWFQGPMEFGPRALGSRSILADPRDPTMRDRINARVKMREDFRPFAPAVLESRAAEYFHLDHASPFMLETCQVKAGLGLPATTHVDGSARVQTVNESSRSRFARLIDIFGRATGCPILLNTSFNMRDEPIVCTPVDALLSFTRCGLDALALEDFVIDRSGLTEAWHVQCRRIPVRHQSGLSDQVYRLV